MEDLKKNYKVKIMAVETLEDLEEVKLEIYAEIIDLKLDKPDESSIRIHVAQCVNLRFHELNDDLESGPIETKGAVNPFDILPSPSKIKKDMDKDKKIITKEKKVIMI